MAVGHPTRSSSFFIENIIGNPNQGQPWSLLTKMDNKQCSSQSLPAPSSGQRQFLQPLLQDAPAIAAHTSPQSCHTSTDNSVLSTTTQSNASIHAKLRHHQQTGKSFDH